MVWFSQAGTLAYRDILNRKEIAAKPCSAYNIAYSRILAIRRDSAPEKESI